MNDKQFCFIICTNNDVLVNECISYINRLYVPEGYEYDIITIKEADSMTSGYNAAMKATEAKYKIYMHQDVFIINRYFMYDLLTVFNSDSSIGMIGLVGYKKINRIGVMWEEERFGMVPMYGVSDYYKDYDLQEYRYQHADGYYIAKVADGLLLATAYDVEWDEKFDAWDFYDASQCLRFQNAGYKLAIPVQKLPWAIHDDGKYLNLSRYNTYREMFLKKYVNTEQKKKKLNVIFINSVTDKGGKELADRMRTVLESEMDAEAIYIDSSKPYHVIFRKIQTSNADIIIDINAAGRVFRTELNEMSYTILGNKIAFVVNDNTLDKSFFEETFNLSHFLSVEDKALFLSCSKEMTHIPNLYNSDFRNDEGIKSWFELMKKEMELA